MRFKARRRWKILIGYWIGWTLAFIFLSIVRGVGTEEMGGLKFDFIASIIISLTMGPIIGTISGLAQIWSEEKIYRRISIQQLLGLRVIYAILFQLVMVLIAYGIYQFYFGTDLGIVEFAFDEGSYAIYFYVLAVDLFLAVLRQVNLMLGKNNLLKLLMGRFYKPREEERIFMFLDLQSSTQHAEKLGHIRYSKLIQDCFNDLAVVLQNEAEIYQYVGDEAVLTWKLNEGLRSQNCIRAFFSFKQRLEKKRHQYEKKYKIMPVFKAGMNVGVVTVTEVGKYKKEIAYHGDTVNTAARIQAKCNELDHELLVSEALMNRLDHQGFRFDPMGIVPLRGKKKEVAIYAVIVDSEQDR